MAGLEKNDRYVLAYVNHGRWVADCSREHCANAMELAPGQLAFACSNCQWVVDIVWPDDADEIWQVLQRRPVPQTRNWFPRDHPLALAARCPHGQSVRDLVDENAEHGIKR